MINHFNSIFKDVCLDGERTLLECSFYDFNHAYFENTTASYLENINENAETLVSNWLLNDSTKLNKYKSIAVEGILKRQRPFEQISSINDVKLSYLIDFSNSCGFLSRKASKFFFISAVKIFLEHKNSNYFFMDDLITTLENPRQNFNHLLDEPQILFIRGFLDKYFPDEENYFLI